jgi:hypothetical protein
MPKVISKDWGITARNVLKRVEDFYVRCGSHCLGIALVGTVGSPLLGSAFLSSEGMELLLSAFTSDPVQRQALIRLSPRLLLQAEAAKAKLTQEALNHVDRAHVAAQRLQALQETDADARRALKACPYKQ